MSTRPGNKLTWVNAARLAVFAVAVGLTIHWHLHYAGLYWFIVQVQLWMFGSYVPILTWCLVLVSLMLPAIPLIWCVERLIGFAPGSSRLPDESVIRFYQFVRTNRDYVFALASIAAGVTVGGYFLGRAYLVGPMCVTSALRLNAGEAPASTFVEITGCSSDRLTVVRKFQGGRSTHVYFPLASADQPGASTVHVLVQVHELRWQHLQTAANPVTLRGVLTRGGESGFVRDELRKRGGRIAADAWLLEEGETPENLANLGFAMLGGFGGFGLIIGAIGTIVRRRGRRLF